MDRASLALPGDQDRLIAAVAAANPAHGGGAQHRRAGPDAVARPGGAVVQAWLPGQQFGEAVAAVLFGDADPGGRLPVTFPATSEQGPITGPERYPGVDGDARYDEGALSATAGTTSTASSRCSHSATGLSYGEYEYGQPRLDRDEATGSVTVSVQVTNVGGRAGAEVVQVYVAAPAAAPAAEGLRQGPARAGGDHRGRPRLDRDDLAAFDEASGHRVVHLGRYEVLVGRSSRDLRGRPGDGPCRPAPGSWRGPPPSRSRRGCGGEPGSEWARSHTSATHSR